MPNSTVCLSFDFDALSVWFGYERTTPAMLACGEYGARVGVPRILALLEEHGLPATFFVRTTPARSTRASATASRASRRSSGAGSRAGTVPEIWTGELDWMDEHVDGGVLTVCMHPQVIGRGHRLAMLERFVEPFRGRGARFATMGDVARQLSP